MMLLPPYGHFRARHEKHSGPLFHVRQKLIRDGDAGSPPGPMIAARVSPPRGSIESMTRT